MKKMIYVLPPLTLPKTWGLALSFGGLPFLALYYVTDVVSNMTLKVY